MKQLKKYLNFIILTILGIIYYIYLTANLFFFADSINYAIPYDLAFFSFFTMIVIAPITEELIFRYWAYGKNIQLQFSIFIIFILYIIIDIVQTFVSPILYITSNIYINYSIKICSMLTLGLILYCLFKRINFKIPEFFIKFKDSKLCFYFVVFIFAIVHLYGENLSNNNLDDYLDYFISSYLITKHAKYIGIFAAILIHMVKNSIFVLSEIIFIRNAAKNLVSNQLILTYFVIATAVTLIYFFHVYKKRTNISKSKVIENIN